MHMSPVRLIGPHDLVEVGPGIYYSHYQLPMIDHGVVELLKDAARSIPRRRARFCAPTSPSPEQHDMLIASHRETYVAPHRHLDRSESFLIVEGSADILLFDERGGLE